MIVEVMNLKVKIVSTNEKYPEIEEKLKQSGFIISDDAEFIFKEVNYVQNTFIGSIEDEFEVIHISKIIYFEAFDHNVFIKTLEKKYRIKEKLYEVEVILNDKGFVRINKSQIINKFGIKTLIPSMNSRFNIVMKNNDLLYVTRVYSSKFKESIGFK